MSKRLILLSAWCAFLIVVAGVATWFAWSPFSDDERPAASAYRGPTHK